MKFALPSSLNKANIWISFFDFLWVIVSPVLAFFIRGDNLLTIENISTISPVVEYILISTILSIFSLIIFRVGDSVVHVFGYRDLLKIFNATFLSLLLSLYVIFTLSRLEGIPRSIPLLHGMVLFSGLSIYRLVHAGFREEKANLLASKILIDHNYNSKKIIIFGVNQFSISVIKMLETQKPKTVQVVSAITTTNKYLGKAIHGIKIIGSQVDIKSIIMEYGIHGVKIDEIWYSSNSDLVDHHYFKLVERACYNNGIKFKSITDALNLTPITMDGKDKKTNITYSPSNPSSYTKLKRFLDVVCSIILLVILTPIFIFLCLLTYYQIGSPIFFWQERIGFRANKFIIYKLRTLALPLSRGGELLDDARRTSNFGLIIRRLRLDEIPQLWSIIMGYMSGIGPRPLLPRDQPECAEWRLQVRPGLTGWAQVNGGELLTPEEKNALDCWYVYHLSFKIDFIIVIKTLGVLINGVSLNTAEVHKAMIWYQEFENHPLNER